MKTIEFVNVCELRDPMKEREDEVYLYGRQKLEVDVYFVILDILRTILQKRGSSHKLMFARFHLLLNIHDESASAEEIFQELKIFMRKT